MHQRTVGEVRGVDRAEGVVADARMPPDVRLDEVAVSVERGRRGSSASPPSRGVEDSAGTK